MAFGGSESIQWNTCFCMDYSLGPRVDPRIRRVLATISRVDPRVIPKVGPSQVRVDPNVEESQLRATVLEGELEKKKKIGCTYPPGCSGGGCAGGRRPCRGGGSCVRRPLPPPGLRGTGLASSQHSPLQHRIFYNYLMFFFCTGDVYIASSRFL